MIVTERFKKYLARNRTCVFNVYSKFVGGIDLNQTEINNGLDKLK